MVAEPVTEQLVYTPQPKQEAWHACDAWESGFGGTKGPGKTMALVMEALRYIYHPRYRGIIFRREYPRLQEIMDRAWQWYPGTGGKWNGEERSWTWPTGSKLYMRHCSNEEDKRNYHGHEYQFMGFDQLEEFTSSQYEFLIAQNRTSIPELKPYVRATFNPGGISHGYIKQRFIDHGSRACAPWTPINDVGTDLESRCFHFATLADNPALEQSDPGYRRRLEGLSLDDRRALLEGDWEVFAGQFFSEWRREKHVCSPFPIPLHWTKRGIGVDWGFGAPWAALFFVRDEDLWSGERIERWYCYRELYGKRLMDNEQARLIAEGMAFDKGQAKGSVLKWSKQADPSMFNKKPGGYEHSVIDAYRAVGRVMGMDLSFERGNNDRINGWQEVRGLLADREDGKPGLIFFDTCLNTIRTFPACVHDKTRVEDLDTTSEEHAQDAVRMWAMGRTGGWFVDVAHQPIGIRGGGTGGQDIFAIPKVGVVS